MAELTKQFVPVRIVQMDDADLDQFQFDYDLTWAAFFMNADGTIYGRYGTRAARDAMTHISEASLTKAMERALALHKDYPKNKALFDGKRGPKSQYASVREIKPLAERMANKNADGGGCIHCHMVYEGSREVAYEERKFERDSIWVHPLPENVGMLMNVDEGTTVQKVLPHSFAEKAGIKAGDVVQTLNGQAILSQADIQWVLHWLPTPGTVEVAYLRNGKPGAASLKVEGDWRKRDISWRGSMWGLHPKPGFWAPELSKADKEKFGIASENLALKVQWVGSDKSRKAGLREGDIIVAFDGSTKDETPLDLNVRLRLTYDPYDLKNVPVTVIRNGQRVELNLPLE